MIVDLDERLIKVWVWGGRMFQGPKSNLVLYQKWSALGESRFSEQETQPSESRTNRAEQWGVPAGRTQQAKGEDCGSVALLEYSQLHVPCIKNPMVQDAC